MKLDLILNLNIFSSFLRISYCTYTYSETFSEQLNLLFYYSLISYYLDVTDNYFIIKLKIIVFIVSKSTIGEPFFIAKISTTRYLVKNIMIFDLIYINKLYFNILNVACIVCITLKTLKYDFWSISFSPTNDYKYSMGPALPLVINCVQGFL